MLLTDVDEDVVQRCACRIEQVISKETARCKHHVVAKLLRYIVKISVELASAEACCIEYMISEEVYVCLKNYLIKVGILKQYL